MGELGKPIISLPAIIILILAAGIATGCCAYYLASAKNRDLGYFVAIGLTVAIWIITILAIVTYVSSVITPAIVRIRESEPKILLAKALAPLKDSDEIIHLYTCLIWNLSNIGEPEPDGFTPIEVRHYPGSFQYIDEKGKIIIPLEEAIMIIQSATMNPSGQWLLPPIHGSNNRRILEAVTQTLIQAEMAIQTGGPYPARLMVGKGKTIRYILACAAAENIERI